MLLYTTSQVLDAAAGREVEQPLRTWTHRVGIAVLPIAGILSRFPEVIGIRSAGTREDFSKVPRTIHAGVGSLTVLAYTITF